MKHIFILLLVLLNIGNVLSQEDDQLLVTELKQSTIVTEPSTLHKGFFKVGAVYSYAVGDKIFTDDGKKEFVPENTWVKAVTYGLLLQYGITNRLELFLQMPFSSRAMYYSSILKYPLLKETVNTKFEIQGTGLGDLTAEIGFQILQGDINKPSLVARLSAVIPTGEKNPTNVKEDFSFDLPMGYGETTLQLELRYRKIVFPHSYGFYGNMKYSFEGNKIMAPNEEEISFKSGNRYSVGTVFSFLLNDWISIKNDLSFNYGQADTFQDMSYETGENSWSLYYLPHLTFQLKRFRFAEGIGIPIIGKSTPADPMYVILAQYIF